MALRAIAFDIIGTCFPLDPLRAPLEALGLPPTALEGWFATGLRDAFALAAAGDFRPFGEVLKGALATVLAQHRRPPASDAAADELVAAMRRLPPRPGLAEALALAGEGGRVVVALSNGARAATEALLAAAGVRGSVAHVLSVDDVGLSKPRPEVYRHAAATAGCAPGELALVAVHPWDINGAAAAGLRTAFLEADGPFSPVMRPPDARGATLAACVAGLLEGDAA